MHDQMHRSANGDLAITSSDDRRFQGGDWLGEFGSKRSHVGDAPAFSYNELTTSLYHSLSDLVGATT
jgi:hypothetical protein